jgi:CHAT domain-containing protein
MLRFSAILSSCLKKLSVHLWALARLFRAFQIYLSRSQFARTPALYAQVSADFVRMLLSTGDVLVQARPWGKPGGRLRSIWALLTIWHVNLIVILGLVVAHMQGAGLSEGEVLQLRHFAENALQYYESIRGIHDPAPTGWWTRSIFGLRRRMMRIQRTLSYALQHVVLGFAYTQLNVGDLSQNLRRAFGYYQSAADILTQEDLPIFAMAAAGVLAALGNACLKYPTENRAEYAQRAIEALNRAKDIATRYDAAIGAARQGQWRDVYSNNPSRFAVLKYAVRLSAAGSRAAWSGQSVEPSLLVGAVPFFVAWLHWKLGLALQTIGDLETSLIHFDSALELMGMMMRMYEGCAKDTHLQTLRGTILACKGSAYLGRRSGTRGENVHMAIAGFSEAIKTLKALPAERWALKTYALSLIGDAQAYFELEAMGKVSREKQKEFRAKVVNQLRVAARLSRKAEAFQVAEEALILLWKVYQLQGDKAHAWRALVLSSRLLDRMQRRSRSYQLSRYWVSKAAGLYELLVRTALEYEAPKGSPSRLTDPSRIVLRSAFSYFERGRTLFLHRELASRDPLPRGARHGDPSLGTFFSVRREWLEAELRYLDQEKTPEFRLRARLPRFHDRLSVIERRYLQELEAVKQEFGDPEYDPDRLAPPIGERQLSEIVDRLSRAMNTALVEYFISDRYLIVSVILPGLVVLKHAGISRAELDEIEKDWREGSMRLLAKRTAPDVIPVGPIQWERHYLHQVLERLRPAVARPAETIAKWEAKSQRRIKRVIVIPHRFLHLVPLHAVDLPNVGMWGDLVRIQYAPSASVLLQLLNVRVARKKPDERDPASEAPPVVAVSYAPTEPPLIFHEHEARAVAEAMGGGQIIGGKDATRHRVKQAIRGAAYVHLACHGEFDPQEPLDGGLNLAPDPDRGNTTGSVSVDGQGAGDQNIPPDDGRMRLGEIFQEIRLSRARLVVLSACKTGLTKIEQRHEEYIGLPAGFLHAGATTVVSSLWPVADVATWLLMRTFAQYVASGMSSAEALRSSQRELRGLPREFVLQEIATAAHGEPDPARRDRIMQSGLDLQGDFPFAGPYWWAGFTVNGLGDVVVPAPTTSASA